MCRVWTGRDQWATLALVIDCHTRELLGWQLSRSCKAKTAESALEQALIARYGCLGRVPSQFLLRSDNGLVFTSRSYTALVRGRPASRRGTIEAPIGRDRRDPTRVSLDSDVAKPAVTHFTIAELCEGRTLLDVELETGRTHQIRVHLAAIGCPVVGDRVYGHGLELGLERQFLHAARLRFPHPWSGEQIDVTSPLPPRRTA